MNIYKSFYFFWFLLGRPSHDTKNALPTTSVLQKQGIRANLNICATIIICGLIELLYF
jgi:hypothetical protein